MLEADEHGLIVLEIAPGIDLDRDVLANFEICPRVSDRIGLMPDLVFWPGRFQASRSVRETSRPQNAPPAGFAARSELIDMSLVRLALCDGVGDRHA